MDSAVSLAWWPRHDGDPCVEQVFACHIKIGVSSTEYSWEKRLQAGVDFIKGFFETCTRLLIDFLNGILQSSQCTFEVFILLI